MLAFPADAGVSHGLTIPLLGRVEAGVGVRFESLDLHHPVKVETFTPNGIPDPLWLPPEARNGLIVSRQVEIASSDLQNTTVDESGQPFSLPYPSVSYCDPLSRRHLRQGAVEISMMLRYVSEAVQIRQDLVPVGRGTHQVPGVVYKGGGTIDFRRQKGFDRTDALMHPLLCPRRPETCKQSVQTAGNSSIVVAEPSGMTNMLELGHYVDCLTQVCERGAPRRRVRHDVHDSRLSNTSNPRPTSVIRTREGHDVVLTRNTRNNRQAPVHVFNSGQYDLVLIVEDGWRAGIHLGQEGEIGLLDLPRFDLTQPSAPFIGEWDRGAGESPTPKPELDWTGKRLGKANQAKGEASKFLARRNGEHQTCLQVAVGQARRLRGVDAAKALWWIGARCYELRRRRLLGAVRSIFVGGFAVGAVPGRTA